jgi:hypothetical protein
MQWLADEDPALHPLFPNNIDAAFKKHTRKPKPSELLLHYNYGVAAVKLWGYGIEVLQDRPDLPHPAVPAPAEMGPSKTLHDRILAIKKRDEKRDAAQPAAGASAGSVASRDRPGKIMADRAKWDEDDVVLFFWGNSPAAIERHRKKQEESTQSMEQWRRGVPSI